jgi:hypothetical protein
MLLVPQGSSFDPDLQGHRDALEPLAESFYEGSSMIYLWPGLSLIE